MDGATRQKNKEIEDLENTINQLDLTEINEYFTKKSTVHILLKCTRNISQDRLYVRPQNKS